MSERKLGKRCRFATECPIYNGKIEIDKMPKYLYRNVFCERGEKGWNNCKQYSEYIQSETPIS